ncbi:hypothetical protein OH76DRAFT_1398315 [Lentinus brumalis]|uniref:BTB domain-containing protein n=1 Tax=Lentinus brumalis TaxID=2498619 RepID=A0A371DNG4_9APHY|nr:hypothetical protein OH76DRAFT_1398315 [Polyporus brumalis]
MSEEAFPSPSTQTRQAPSPFDRSDADLILHTKDDVNFSVHRLVLSLASPIFETMFFLPQPPGTEPRPSVDVSEDSQTIETFLRIVYPVADPEIKSLQHLREVLAAGTKYDAPAVIAASRKALVQKTFIEADPLRVFAIACIFGMEAEAQAAAEVAVMKNRVTAGAEPCADIAEITAGAYFRLLQLKRARTRNATSLFGLNMAAQFGQRRDQRDLVDLTGIGSFCDPPRLSPSPTAHYSIPPERLNCYHLSGTTAFPPDIGFRSHDGSEFPAHRVIIEMASSAMLTMLGRSDRHGDMDLHMYDLQEGALVIQELLRLCYPVTHLPAPPHPPTDAKHFLDVLFASRKYQLAKAEMILRERWPAVAGKEPLRFYFAAARCGWEEEALLCARELINQSDDVSLIETQYLPEMESMQNRSYLYLLSYVGRCVKAASYISTLSGLPQPCCNHEECRKRYPKNPSPIKHRAGWGFEKEHQPSWLFPYLGSLENTLRKKPRGQTLSTVASRAATSFITAVVGDSYTCPIYQEEEERFGISDFLEEPEEKCGIWDKVAWATTFLDQYAKAVDQAVAEVKLKIPSTTTA